MARSCYIYLVRIKETTALLGYFTVKHEASAYVLYELETL